MVGWKLRRAARRLLVGSPGPRRYLASGLDLERFFELLAERDVSYVVLRWFDTLPHVEPGEDIDLLVADEDLAFVRTLLVGRPGLRHRRQKFDLYSVSGLPGSDFGGIPYYPPRFAGEILHGAESRKGRFRVPSPEHHLDSLAYHALYHKGYASGLPGGRGATRPAPTPDHDYEDVLAKLAADTGTAVRPTLEDLDAYLAGKGLRPPLDTLERLEPRNPWIRDRFLASLPAVDALWRGLAVFVLRERAEGMLDVATRELNRQGFEVLDVVHLDGAQREAAAHRIRGGAWERGPWPVSGGPPTVFLVAYDVAPRQDPGDESGANQRIPRAKADLRSHLLRDVPAQERYNPLHSSDNPRQALDYLDVLADRDAVERIRARASRLLGAVAFPYPVLRALPAEGKRAQVAVVDHPVHGPAVCKVFRPGAARFLARELRARRELADLPEIPPLLDSGDSWLVTPLLTDDRRHVRRRLPGRDDVQLTAEAARAMARFAAALHSRGSFLLDLSTKNLMSDPRAGLTVLDLEFLQTYEGPAPGVLESYTFRGAAGDGNYDVPQMSPRALLTDRIGNSVFHPAVAGLPVAALLAPDRADRRVRQRVVQLGWYAYFAGRSAAGAAKRSPLGRTLGYARKVATLARHGS